MVMTKEQFQAMAEIFNSISAEHKNKLRFLARDMTRNESEEDHR